MQFCVKLLKYVWSTVHRIPFKVFPSLPFKTQTKGLVITIGRNCESVVSVVRYFIDLALHVGLFIHQFGNALFLHASMVRNHFGFQCDVKRMNKMRVY